MYKRYAFLRREEEREQFLCHILSLNAVDFSCFTHTFILTSKFRFVFVSIRFFIFRNPLWSFGSKQHRSVCRFVDLDHVNGFIGIYLKYLSTFECAQIHIRLQKFGYAIDTSNRTRKRKRRATVEMEIELCELLLASNYRDKRFQVLVRNNITGQTFLFNCGRWFGRGVDDGAIERLLVAEQYYGPGSTSSSDINSSSLNPDTNTEFDEHHSHRSGNDTNLYGGFISRPESPVSTTAQRNNTFNYYSTGSLARRRRSPSVSKSSSEYIGPNKQLGIHLIIRHFYNLSAIEFLELIQFS